MRNSLDSSMRAILAQLELVSAIPAVNYDASHGTDDDPGGRKPPGDLGYAVYAAWYGLPFSAPTPQHPGCVTDRDREDCIGAARRELNHLRKGQHVLVDEVAALEDQRRRVLTETEGWSLQDVACSHWRMNMTLLRRLRVADGRDSESGRPVTSDPSTGEDLASRAKVMKQAGMSLRAIGMALGGLDQKQVQRFLKRVA